MLDWGKDFAHAETDPLIVSGMNAQAISLISVPL
jgi:hypothetical protein